MYLIQFSSVATFSLALLINIFDILFFDKHIFCATKILMTKI